MRFEVGDVLDPAVPDEFDVVVSFNVLHWLVDQQCGAGLDRRRRSKADRPGDRPAGVRRARGRAWKQLAMQVCAGARWRDAFAGFAAPFVHVDPVDYPQIAAAAGLLVTDLQVRGCRLGLRFAGGVHRLVHGRLRRLDGAVDDGADPRLGRRGGHIE